MKTAKLYLLVTSYKVTFNHNWVSIPAYRIYDFFFFFSFVPNTGPRELVYCRKGFHVGSGKKDLRQSLRNIK